MNALEVASIIVVSIIGFVFVGIMLIAIVGGISLANKNKKQKDINAYLVGKTMAEILNDEKSLAVFAQLGKK